MTDEKKPEPFEFVRMTDAHAIELVKELDLPQEAIAVARNHSWAAEVRDHILGLVGLQELSCSVERTNQANVLWNLGVGRALGFEHRDEYFLRVPLPKPNPNLKRFDRLILVDRRLGVIDLCRALGVGFHLATNQMLTDARWDPPDVEFIWCQDGRRDRGRSITDCARSFVDGEVPLTAIEGLCLWAQDKSILTRPDPFAMDLPGSVSTGYPDRATYLRQIGRSMELESYRPNGLEGISGTATRAI